MTYRDMLMGLGPPPIKLGEKVSKEEAEAEAAMSEYDRLANASVKQWANEFDTAWKAQAKDMRERALAYIASRRSTAAVLNCCGAFDCLECKAYAAD